MTAGPDVTGLRVMGGTGSTGMGHWEHWGGDTVTLGALVVVMAPGWGTGGTGMCILVALGTLMPLGWTTGGTGRTGRVSGGTGSTGMCILVTLGAPWL